MERPSRPRRARRLLRVALLVAVSLAAALVCAELAIRATDPYGISYFRDVNRYVNHAIAIVPEAAHPDGRIFQARPNVDLALETFRFATDRHGFRAAAPGGGPEPARDPADPRRRILFLGDSVTLGWGVDDADTWVRTIEREGRGPGGEPLECLNAGHLIYNSIQEADLLATLLPAFRPDAVVLTFVVNDGDDSFAAYTDLERALAAEAGAEAGPLERLRRRLPVWFRGLHGLLHLRATRAEARTTAELAVARVEDAPGYAESWARIERGLERARALCAEAGVPLLVLDHSTPRVADVERWCAARGVRCARLAFTDEEWARGVTNSLADAHANALGNRLLADKALAALAGAGILSPPPR